MADILRKLTGRASADGMPKLEKTIGKEAGPRKSNKAKDRDKAQRVPEQQGGGKVAGNAEVGAPEEGNGTSARATEQQGLGIEETIRRRN